MKKLDISTELFYSKDLTEPLRGRFLDYWEEIELGIYMPEWEHVPE